MKNKSLLLASLVLLATAASAAQYQAENDVLVLPTFTVAVPRYQPAEREINARLGGLRQHAKTPLAVSPVNLSLRAATTQEGRVAANAFGASAVRLAKS